MIGLFLGEKKLPLNGFDVVLANPPFSGKIDTARIVNEVKIGTSKSTELLFIKHIINSLNNNFVLKIIH